MVINRDPSAQAGGDSILAFDKGSDTVLVVAHEIYGINGHMRRICQRLSEHGFDVLCPDLLKRDQPFGYDQTDIAYKNFVENVGFSGAQIQLDHAIGSIRSKYKNCFLVGYSVGATVAWRYSQNKNVLNGIVGYYGSRIRDYMDIIPECSGLLFFPNIEKSFDVSTLVSVLSERKNIQVHTYNAQHGFADSMSPNYCLEASEDAFTKMLNFFKTSVLR